MSRVLRLSPVPPATDVAVETRPSMADGLLESYVRRRVAMLGTTLPTPLYTLYREHFGFSELLEGRS